MIQQPIHDAELERHLTSIAGDGTDLYLMAGGTIRGVFVHGTTLVNRMRVNHELNATGTLVLGQAYLLALLASSTLKDAERLSIVVDVDGPIKGLAAEADSQGHVRGYLRNAEIEAPPSGEIHDLFRDGELAFIRVSPDSKHPFQGQTAWQRGDLIQNVAWYYANSEQTATMLDVSIHLDTTGRVTGAAGLMMQTLPGGDPADLDRIGAALTDVRPLGAHFAAGGTAAHIANTHLGDFAPSLVGTRGAEFFCGCSRERFGSFLGALPQDERDDIMATGPFPLRTTCHNCNTTYRFERDDLAELFAPDTSSEP